MSDTINRPKAGKKKIHSKNEFELCYLRHQYFRKTKFNPTKEEMEPFIQIASYCAKNTYYTYKNLFGLVGFDVDDIISIAQIHLVSFLGLFTLEKMPEKYAEFVEVYEMKNLDPPTEQDVENKNKANLTLFLKQRMEDVVRVCRQKARNIKGLPTEEHFYYCGPKKPPKLIRDLVGDHERYGYRKLDMAVYKSIKKRVKSVDGPVFKLDGNYYVAVPVEKKMLSLTDFTGADMSPYDNIHNMNPEEIVLARQDQEGWVTVKEKFRSKSPEKRASMVKRFIKENKNNPLFKEEIKTAKRLLKNFGG